MTKPSYFEYLKKRIEAKDIANDPNFDPIPITEPFEKKRYSPEWLLQEIAARRENPDPEYYVVALTLHTISPSGDIYPFKLYQKAKKQLSIDDLVRLVRFFEDKSRTIVAKNGIMSLLAEKIIDERELMMHPDGKKSIVLKRNYIHKIEKKKGYKLDEESK